MIQEERSAGRCFESESVKNVVLLRMAAIEDMLSDTRQGQLSRHYADNSGELKRISLPSEEDGRIEVEIF